MQFRSHHFARAEALRRSNVEVARLDITALCTAARRRSGWNTAALVWRSLNRIAPAVLLIHGYRERSAVTAALWGRVHGARTILMSDSTLLDRPRKTWRERLKGLAARALFDSALVSGSRAATYLTGLGFPRRSIGYGYDVVDNEFFATRAARLRSSASPGDFDLPESYFLFVGRFVSEKNLPGLIRGYAEYHARGGRASLVLVGEGPLEPHIRQLVERAGLSGAVHFAGSKEEGHLAPFYAFARCLVLPSISESWGLVVNEAMASSLPVVVSSRCGCSADLVRNGENGFTFDPLAPGALASRLRQIEELSPEQSAGMGAASFRLIQQYSLDRWASEVLRLAGPPEAASAGDSPEKVH